MSPLNINQLINNGIVPTSYGSKYYIPHLLDRNALKDLQFDETSELFCQQSSSLSENILRYSSFSNENVTHLLQSALISGPVSFRHALHDFKMKYRKRFRQEINQFDKHQNTLLWYLTLADLYCCIEELYQFASLDLNLSIKNGSMNQCILHYAAIHSPIENIRKILDIGVDTNLDDRFGRTVLHYIAMYGTKYHNDIEIMNLLIDYEALLNQEDFDHRTNLHYAILTKNYDLVKYLIHLSKINVCIRDKYGYTPLCYLCEQIFNLSDISLGNNQCTSNLECISTIINLLIDRCPSNKLSDYCHIIKNGQIGENLLLHMYNKLSSMNLLSSMDGLFNRIQSILIGTNQDRRLLAECLLKLHSWKSAIHALCNTHNVNISDVLIQCIAHDPHTVLINSISPLSDLSIVLMIIYYALSTDVKILRNIVPACEYSIEDEPKLKVSMNTCSLHIENLNLHTTYVTFIHTCLHYARLHTFSLKHLCRTYIRAYIQSNIIDKIKKCSKLTYELRNYLQFNELLLIYSKIDNLPCIVYLIKRLYNIYHIDEYNLFENEINENFKLSPLISIEEVEQSIDLFSDTNVSTQNIIQHLPSKDPSETTIAEDENFVYHRTIEEIMAESDISIDEPMDSTEKTSILNSDSKFNIKQFETELADMNAKSKDLEKMIDRFLLLEN